MQPRFSDIVLDRDGTVIEDRHYLCAPEDIRFLPGAVTALQRLTHAGCRLFVLTNQSGIGRGYFSQEQYHAVQRHLDQLLAHYGVVLNASLFCPHAPSAACSCRKPAPGMLRALEHDHGLVPRRSIVIGDKRSDLQLAQTGELAGAILVATGKGEETAQSLDLAPLQHHAYREGEYAPGIGHFVFARDLTAAAQWLVPDLPLGKKEKADVVPPASGLTITHT